MSAVKLERRDHLPLLYNTRFSRYGVLDLQDFPRYYLAIDVVSLHDSGEGFTVISRYGLADAYPTRNFATLGPFVLLRLFRAVGLSTHSACRHAGRTISSPDCSESGV